jgi:hypothetical protein
MPLHAQAERRVVGPARGLDQTILGESFRLQPIGQPRNALRVQGIDHQFVVADPIAQFAAKGDHVDRAVHLIEWKLLPWAVVLVSVHVVNRLMKAAAKGHVQLLEAAADRE